jgi:hypothetical protein
MSNAYLPGLTDPKFLNALADSSAEFLLVPTPSLRELLAKAEHPTVLRMPVRYRHTMMNVPDGVGVNLDRAMVKRYVNGLSSEDEKFILDRCDIICVKHADVKVGAKA